MNSVLAGQERVRSKEHWVDHQLAKIDSRMASPMLQITRYEEQRARTPDALRVAEYVQRLAPKLIGLTDCKGTAQRISRQ